MKRKSRKAKVKEAPHFHITIAKLCQSLAYTCLLIGVLALLGIIVGLIIAYWPQSEPSVSSGSSSYQTSSNAIGWIQLMFTLSTGAMIFAEVVVCGLALFLILWGLKSAVRAMRRRTWQLADALMKPLAVVEPVFLLVVWALTILGAWFLVKDELFLTLSLVSLAFLLVGLASFLASRKLAKNYLDFTRADLVFRR
jgi:hypothetical protein